MRGTCGGCTSSWGKSVLLSSRSHGASELSIYYIDRVFGFILILIFDLFSWKRQRNKIWTRWNRRNRFSIFLPRFSAELWTFVFRFVFWLHIKIRLTKSNTVQTDWFRPWLMEGSSSGGVLSTSIINLCLLIRVYLTFFFVVSELLKAKNMFLNTLRTFH